MIHILLMKKLKLRVVKGLAQIPTNNSENCLKC